MLQTVYAVADRRTLWRTERLDVRRIDAGRLELRKQGVDLHKATNEAIAGRGADGEPESRFVTHRAEDLPEVWADPDKIDQVVGNLVENALRHGAGTVTVTVSPFDGGVEVLVEDEGEGIPPETAARVFTRFCNAAVPPSSVASQESSAKRAGWARRSGELR